MVARGGPSRAFYGALHFLSWIAGALLFDVRSFGAHRVPRRGPLVLASNHQSFLDPWLVGIFTPRQPFYLARENLFRFAPLRWLIENLNALPIPRGGAASRRAIELGRAVLRSGEAVVIFPEGTRTRDGSMGPLKRGVDLICRPAGAPVVPTYIDGSFKAWPPHRMLPGLCPVRVFYGAPLATRKRVEPAGAGVAPAPRGGNDEGLSAELVTRLKASYRSLEARARRVRWSGAAGSSGRPHYFG